MASDELLKILNAMAADEEQPADDDHRPAVCMHSDKELYDWIEERKDNTHVALSLVKRDECTGWYYDDKEGCIRNEKGSFFKIFGAQWNYTDPETGENVCVQQPVIEQNEIGFLGILCCKYKGEWHYLMQAKIEPGNVNVVQLSPTLQATRSNFTQAHGGKKPQFLEYFTGMKPEDIIVDQIQSEQSSRFMHKRNRNVILMVDHLLDEPDTHRWMTLSQIKGMMHCDNLVNMDTRTVLSCIPYVLMGQEGDAPFKNKPYFYKTAWSMNRRTLAELYHEINDYKMFADAKVSILPLCELSDWEFTDKEFICKKPYPFKVVFCDIDIEGREVTHWSQPLFAANGRALFGLLCCDDEGVMKFLVKVRNEIGCFDGIEIGPTVQREACGIDAQPDRIWELFMAKLNAGEDIIADAILSEEGGRFYQEENRNAIVFVKKEDVGEVPKGYVWSDYGTLNILTQVNNCLNIQLRNLLSLIEL